MSRLVGAELLKLRTIRTTWGFALALVGLVVLFVTIPLFAARSVETPDDVRDVISSAGVSSLVMLVYGIVGITTEHRHGTLGATLLATPARPRVLAAKALAHAIAGVAFGTLALLVAGLLVGGWAVGRTGDVLPSTGAIVQLAVGTIALAAVLGAFGVGLGALIPGQAAAITAVLLLLLVVEPLLGAGSQAIADYGLNASIDALSAGVGRTMSQGAGGLLLLGYTLVVLVAGGVVMTRRDVAA